MQQLNFNNKTKTDLAIEFIQAHEPPEGYFLGDSGGKDSTVLRHLTIKSGVRYHRLIVIAEAVGTDGYGKASSANRSKSII